ncbi:flagellar type III secretion system protein FlhB [Roseococcus sp. SDR]|uniref:EscU/YscU/HrcU family type III secretion system export apparatus switch protein n=1 Tax=Roseococcus sp. SDR TaxID=2835532 RepID=UPI001BD1AA5B|nr:EscU/YscU/HrcU family type III secretion system export apparatus switch protein [Roseococcus sp. SDR]MBS7788631.1 flagellar type III secretion system protein FlhB [Roseococcus sp. SDR]MBV1843945.1 flagellar type III secretion system protein FlhB [Roseococcus sp. SDR]
MAEQEEDDSSAEKTEAPTQRRLDQAAQQGNIALSREAVGFATLLATTLLAAILLPGQVSEMAAAMRGTLGRAHELGAGMVAREWLGLFLALAWPVAAAAVAGAVIATLAQTRGVISASAMAPSLAKISPIAGVTRILGPDGLLEFARTLIKLVIVAAAIWYVTADLPGLAALLEAPPAAMFGAAGGGVLRLLGATLAAFALLVILDLILVRFRHLTRLRMSRQELKEEMKESEGDPLIKGRLRQLREAAGRRRMMAAVPRATVVITNPTHYAVALAYEPGQAAAPRVVAKGVDAMAARIREVARQAGVPVMADPPLARALYRVELEEEIPAEHWDAAARIIAYVMRLRGGP